MARTEETSLVAQWGRGWRWGSAKVIASPKCCCRTRMHGLFSPGNCHHYMDIISELSLANTISNRRVPSSGILDSTTRGRESTIFRDRRDASRGQVAPTIVANLFLPFKIIHTCKQLRQTCSNKASLRPAARVSFSKSARQGLYYILSLPCRLYMFEGQQRPTLASKQIRNLDIDWRHLTSNLTPTSLQPHFNLTLTSLPPHFNLTLTSLQPHFNLSSTSLQPHFNLTSTSLPPHFNLTLTALLPNFTPHQQLVATCTCNLTCPCNLTLYSLSVLVPQLVQRPPG